MINNNNHSPKTNKMSPRRKSNHAFFNARDKYVERMGRINYARMECRHRIAELERELDLFHAAKLSYIESIVAEAISTEYERQLRILADCDVDEVEAKRELDEAVDKWRSEQAQFNG